MSEFDKKPEKWSMESLTQEIVGLNTNRDVFPEKMISQRERAIKEQISLHGWSSVGEMLEDVNVRQKEVGQAKFKRDDFKDFFEQD